MSSNPSDEKHFFLLNIALISVFCLTDGATRIFHDSSLFIFSPRTSHLMVEESPSVRERERVHMAEEEEENSPKNHFATGGIEPTTSVS